jgi:VIT1/CCC1 family predicted Fe2+/Mn2+ transporter
VVLVVDPRERARIMGLLFVLVILLTTPFGWIGGQLSEINRILPFVLLVGLFLIGIALTIVAGRLAEKTASAAPS